MHKNHSLAKLSHKKNQNGKICTYSMLHRLLRSYIVGGACYYHIKNCTDQAVLLFDRWMEDETNLYVVKLAFLTRPIKTVFQFKLFIVIEKYKHSVRILMHKVKQANSFDRNKLNTCIAENAK